MLFLLTARYITIDIHFRICKAMFRKFDLGFFSTLVSDVITAARLANPLIDQRTYTSNPACRKLDQTRNSRYYPRTLSKTSFDFPRIASSVRRVSLLLGRWFILIGMLQEVESSLSSCITHVPLGEPLRNSIGFIRRSLIVVECSSLTAARLRATEIPQVTSAGGVSYENIIRVCE